MSVRPLSTAIKCLELMDILANQPSKMKLADIARLIGESRATAYQRLFTLVTAGWLEATDDGAYRLSIKALRIANAALEQAGMGERSLPILSGLTRETRETSSLVLLDGERIIIAQRVEARGVLRAELSVGAELSFHESASGQIWTAFGPRILPQLLADAGIRAAPKVTLDQVRQDGFAVGGGGETLQGISVVAVPVLDPSGRCLASMSLVGPERRFDVARVLPALKAAAVQMTKIL